MPSKKSFAPIILYPDDDLENRKSPSHDGVRFDYQQGMNEPKLTEQPGTGKPVRRLISGGFTLLRGEQLSTGSVTDSSWHCKD